MHHGAFLPSLIIAVPRKIPSRLLPKHCISSCTFSLSGMHCQQRCFPALLSTWSGSTPPASASVLLSLCPSVPWLIPPWLPPCRVSRSHHLSSAGCRQHRGLCWAAGMQQHLGLCWTPEDHLGLCWAAAAPGIMLGCWNAGAPGIVLGCRGALVLLLAAAWTG